MHKSKCQNQEFTTNRTLSESHLQRKEHFHENPLYFRIYAVFEADNEIENSSKGNEKTNNFKQNPVINGY